MSMSPRTKHMVQGGAIGALALAVGYGLFHSRPAFALPRPEHERHEKHKKHEKRHEDNDRGEYGRKKHEHRGHDRDD